MAFLLYFVGLIVFVAGLGWLATSLGVTAAYVNVGALALLALGLVTAVARVRAERR
jgi:positive regulator of sigma E activity